MVIPRLCWPLLIYKISVSVVKCLELKISFLFKKMALYSSFYYKYRSVFFNLPFPSAFEEFNTNTQINQSQWAFVINRVSRSKNFGVSFSVEMLLLWDGTEAVVDAESRLEFQIVIGYHQPSIPRNQQMWLVSCRRQAMLTQGPAPDTKCKLIMSSFLTLPRLLDCLICTWNAMSIVLLLQIMGGWNCWGVVVL